MAYHINRMKGFQIQGIWSHQHVDLGHMMFNNIPGVMFQVPISKESLCMNEIHLRYSRQHYFVDQVVTYNKYIIKKSSKRLVHGLTTDK